MTDTQMSEVDDLLDQIIEHAEGGAGMDSSWVAETARSVKDLLAASQQPPAQRQADATLPGAAVAPQLLTAARSLVRACSDARWHGDDKVELGNLEEAEASAKEAIAAIDHK